ncbi:SDR family NAD(P)-dependent oxidoreductase [Salinimicrobium tongyeongense]|uniref:SDR family NAD(P)-dependent oxidoreductase n=1 Tax=Salinimicrobium tongyeongense TaxID=2809707 RepID=A0ABY6NWF4_9FLAO|nr:SDR family NAD(P)-dependent oxidoreductase [Salinimicrobium tongyeongense]UZH56803.1 SDR family NAD(P)-dependent oxidoreductase [Salinimicrobium tongyeongense]
MNKTALVTGASSGIGKATAIALAAAGYRLVICGRRKDALESLKNELSAKTEVHILQFDVRDKEKVSEAIQSLPQQFKTIDVLINNAGNAHGLDPIQTGSVTDWDAMIDINVKGLLYVSREIIPQMLKRGSGDIINIGSLAGKEVYPNGNVYSASKHAVDAINQGMRIDLNGKGIRVGAINPGLVETGFSEVRFKGDSEKAKSVYQGYQALKPEDIAELVVFVVSRPRHVNIADLLVLPTAQATSTIVHKE